MFILNEIICYYFAGLKVFMWMDCTLVWIWPLGRMDGYHFKKKCRLPGIALKLDGAPSLYSWMDNHPICWSSDPDAQRTLMAVWNWLSQKRTKCISSIQVRKPELELDCNCYQTFMFASLRNCRLIHFLGILIAIVVMSNLLSHSF